MKKLFLTLALFATLLFTACQKEEVNPNAGSAVVTFSVEVPSTPQTRAIQENGENINDLVYAVYRTTAQTEAEAIANMSTNTLVYQINPESTVFTSEGKTSVSIELLNDQNYVILFWAQVDDAWTGEGTGFDLTNITYPATMNANNQNLAAFSGVSFITGVDGARSESITLTRPFAQINIGTTLPNNFTVTFSGSDLKVTNAAETFNVATQKSSGSTNLTFAKAAIPGDNLTVNSQNYSYVGMNYLFANENVTVEYNIETSHGTVNNTIDNVPVKQNYKTNIIGNLLTSNTTYEITLDDEWGDEGKNMEYVTNGLIKNINGDYEVANANGLAYAINNLWKDGGNYYLTGSTYDLTDYNVVPPVIGTGKVLNIYGNTPIVTRASAASGSVTIIGMDVPFIQLISEGAAVSFSGISTDSNIEFITENRGTVGFSDCSNNEKEGEELIGSNNGTTVNLDNIIDWESFTNAVSIGVNVINLSGDIELNDYTLPVSANINSNGFKLKVSKGKAVTIDLNGNTLSGSSSIIGKNYDMIDVRGTLSISNGTLTTVFKGENMAWNNSTNVFNITDGGVLNLTGVTARNLGGSDMGFVAHLNNWGEVTLNVESSVLESNYVAVRVFNSGPNMNNVVIKNSTLKGGNYAFWVHNYTIADFGEDAAKTAKQQALLNLNIFDNGNTFIGKNNTPIRYGFTNAVYQGPENIAKIGDAYYSSLQDAVNAINEGETIILLRDMKFTEGTNGNGISYTRDVNFTLDLNGKTIKSDLGNNALRFKIGDGNGIINKNVTVEIKNGKIVSGSNNWCAISGASADNSNNKLTLKLSNLEIENYKANDYAVKSWAGAKILANNVRITSSYGGSFYAVGGEMVLENCTANQKGLHTAPYNSMAIAVSNEGKIEVKSGNYTTTPAAATDGNNQGTSHGSWAAGVMNSGGQLIINGGTFANGNYGDDALATYARGLIFGDTASEIIINDGTFNAIKTIIDYQNNLGIQPNPNIIINGGDFSANPYIVTSYGGVALADGKVPAQGANGRWTLVDGQLVNNAEDLSKAFEMGGIIVLSKDITIEETAVLAEGKTVSLDLNGKTLSAADKNTVKNNGGILTIKNGKITRTGDVVGYSVNNASGEIYVENATIQRGLYTSGSKMTVTNANISHDQSSRHAIYSYDCEVTINSGKYHNDNAGNATLMATGSSKVTINGGTFSIADGRTTLGWTSSMIDQNNTAEVIVKGGLFNGGFRINSADTKLTIEGGEFNTNNGSSYTDYSGTKVVKGGTFTDAAAQDWAKKYLAKGFKMNENGAVVPE